MFVFCHPRARRGAYQTQVAAARTVSWVLKLQKTGVSLRHVRRTPAMAIVHSFIRQSSITEIPVSTHTNNPADPADQEREPEAAGGSGGDSTGAFPHNP